MIRNISRIAVASLLLASGISPRAGAEEARPVFQHVLPDMPGKELTVVEVAFPPGDAAAPHHHGQAFVYAYVLAGEVESRLDGEPARIFRFGQSWFEPPGAHHVVTRNMSATTPARLLVVFVADEGAALKTDDR
jgi:quercetin dioxygenase-like cupin family protein